MLRKKIMIVDDDKEFLEELQEMLDSSGYVTLAINDSTTVLDAACIGKPDVILLDLKMNGMDGIRVTEELKGAPETEHIPIIAMTGYFTKDEHSMFVSTCGMEDCLIKPFNPLDVIGRIEMALMKTKT